MKRGLKVTLMTVAVAMLGLKAMAMAPVISDIPSPIIGSDAGATDSTPYVFGDALDLNAYVSDDTTADDQLKWSYAIAGTAKYAINGVAKMNTLDGGADDPTNPGAKQINSQVLQSEVNPDGKTNTVTIRNINIKPFTGTGAAAPSTNGLFDSQVVTLYASDGAAYSSKDIMFYTDQGGVDRLSVPTAIPTQPGGVNVFTHDFNGSQNGWTTKTVAGTLTFSNSSNTALCIASTMTGMSYGGWRSGWGVLPLVDNAVYRIRTTMNFTQAQAGAKTPFWDVVINNYDGTNGYNLFGGDFYCLDNEGGANAIKNGQSASYELWWSPVPLQTQAWKTGLFSAATDNNRNAFLEYRLIDAAGPVPGADSAGGTVCMDQLTVDRFDFTALTQGKTNVYSVTNFVGSGTGQNTNAKFYVGAAQTATFTNGVMGLVANSSGASLEYALVTPNKGVVDYTQPATLADSFPITWEANTLYMITYALSAANANAETNPWDVFWISMDTPTNEVIGESFVTLSNNKIGMPKQGTPQNFTTFYYSGKGTLSTTQNATRLRPRLALANSPDLLGSNATGVLNVHSISVDKVVKP